mgnify:CR=1 FL=1
MTEELIKTTDECIDNSQYEEAYTKLKKGLENPENRSGEVYWRMARASKLYANTITGDKEKNKAIIYEAFENIKLGMEKEPENWQCNKWYAILLDLTARFEGIKKRIENSYLVRDHLMKAQEKNPSDATTLHSLGVWCFEVSDLPWLQKKLAATFFATPPSSTYEEALKHLSEAEKVNPNFYSGNLLYLGKVHHRLKNKEEAAKYLKQTVEYDGNGADDIAAKSEAAELLKKL